jgi:Mn-dependent DtxR family transcriptional regulator
LEEETIYRDVEGMEHHVSRPTLAVIRAIADLLEANPRLLQEARSRIDPGTWEAPGGTLP